MKKSRLHSGPNAEAGTDRVESEIPDSHSRTLPSDSTCKEAVTYMLLPGKARFPWEVVIKA